mmetsp:Transcript_35030/g.79526  ORF Transcript_35030/g.79526 Transcript_35030/m.79526 type:complete len:109 (-) Transcript_35030:565-891(-)
MAGRLLRMLSAWKVLAFDEYATSIWLQGFTGTCILNPAVSFFSVTSAAASLLLAGSRQVNREEGGAARGVARGAEQAAQHLNHGGPISQCMAALLAFVVGRVGQAQGY